MDDNLGGEHALLVDRAVDHLAKAIDLLNAHRLDPDVDDWLATRAELGRRLSDVERVLNGCSELLGVPSATGRIARYLAANPGRVVSKEELRGVAGIEEWARRVRELREAGWAIQTGTTSEDLRIDEYRLAERPALGHPPTDR